MIVRYLFVLIFSFTDGFYLRFARPSYDVLVSESTGLSASIGRIEAIASPDLTLEYQLHGDTNGTFLLNASTGELTLVSSLDYERIPLYQLTIEARSSPPVVAPCFAELLIHLLNVNDHPPEIDLIAYSSSKVIIYDLQRSSTPFATIHLKDHDESTKNLSLQLNDSEHFQLELLRQVKGGLLTESLYILSTRNNQQLLDHQYSFGLLIHACDHDQPNLCSTRSSRWQLQSKVYRCYLSFPSSSPIIDINEDLSMHTLIFSPAINQSCEKISFALDDTRHFFVDSQTGDVYTSTPFNRTEQSLYRVHLLLDHALRIPLTIRVLDQIGRRPFLTRKHLRLSPQRFRQVHLSNSSTCHAATIVESYFQLLSNCTLRALVIPPPAGRYRFTIDLKDRMDYQDTFVLELEEERSRAWVVVLCVSLLLLLLLIALVVISRRSLKKHQSPRSRLQVHDDDPPSKQTRVHDDEGYSGSSNVSDVYDVPRLRICTDVSLV